MHNKKNNMENDNKMEAQRQQFVLFGKLIAFIPLSVVALVYSWNFIASKYHSPIADFSLPVLYFILASIFGFYFPRVLFYCIYYFYNDIFLIFIISIFYSLGQSWSNSSFCLCTCQCSNIARGMFSR